MPLFQSDMKTVRSQFIRQINFEKVSRLFLRPL